MDNNTIPAVTNVSPNVLVLCAVLAHENNKNICEFFNDFSQLPWTQTSEESKLSTLENVSAVVKKRDMTAEEMHDIWVEGKKARGFSYAPGPKTDTTHPDMVDFKELDLPTRLKDEMFIATVNSVLKTYGY